MQTSSAAAYVPGRVSVVIPTHNRSAWLEQAVRSCALQTWDDVEVIVVDDGSEEDIASVVASLHREFPQRRIEYARQERRGGAAARNAGARLATGEFVQFLDSDDLLHPDKFAAQAEVLRGRPDLDFALCLEELFVEAPGDERVLWNVPRRKDCRDDLERFLLEDAPWSTGGPLWRHASLDRVGAWDETLRGWQDWQFHVQALCRGVKYDWVCRSLHYIREHAETRTSQVRTLAGQRACYEAGIRARAALDRAGLLDGRPRWLLLEYFERHLEIVAGLTGPDAGALARDLTAAMGPLSRSPRRRFAIGVLRALSGRARLLTLVKVYRAMFSHGPVFQPLRAIVVASVAEPVTALTASDRASFDSLACPPQTP